MLLTKLLQNNNVPFKLIDTNGKIKIFKILNKLNICFVTERGNQFQLDRDTFDYLNENSIPYWLLLHDTALQKLYLLVLKQENNWVKSCFEGCDKGKIYLGKQVLNSAISNEDFVNKVKELQ
ncbi:hypothetical protein [Chryseobacterium sp.]|uniref:hypothetical protein n=1 Tax=Chryseobacterium sp. TaxID=1871047 RepID=UPI002FC62723